MFFSFKERWRCCPESILMEPETTAFLSQPQWESIVLFSAIEFEGRALDKWEETFPKVSHGAKQWGSDRTSGPDISLPGSAF